MNTKTSRRQKDIKSKLMAAIAMLLVSSIMMVSTTYAWFTLSTAPEVTGISTSVGANGNLEMALVPVDGSITKISSDSGDGNKEIAEKNITWGNLVDLSANNIYGLDKIKLYPSALNAENGEIKPAMLMTPEYGADGRVTSLVKKTTTAIYSAGSFDANNSGFGVRAVGISSGMTQRELDYKNAISDADTATRMASTKAKQALENNGTALASIAVKQGMDKNTKFTQADVDALDAMITDLEAALAQIDTAYMKYILAYAASSLNTNEVAYTAVKTLVEGAANLAEVEAGLATAGVTLADGNAIKIGMDAYKATLKAVDDASKALPETKSEYTWTDDLSGVVTALANPSNMKVNDLEISAITSNPQELIDSYFSNGNKLEVEVPTDSGVFADIADHTEDYYAKVQIKNISYGTLNVPQADAYMNIVSAKEPTYLKAVGAALNGKAPEVDENSNAAKPLTEMYGYVIDLAFRTNAANSNLMLQVDAVDRIYSDQTGADTMGGGASMTFSTISEDILVLAEGQDRNAKVKNLMNAIRIVFFDPTANNAIIAKAKLDAANATQDDKGLTAKMYLYDDVGDVYSKYPGDGAIQAGVDYYQQTTEYKVVSGVTADTFTTDLYIKAADSDTYTKATAFDATATYYSAEVKYTKVTPTTNTGDLYILSVGGKLDDNTLIALNQNQATALSVLVYLDGNMVGNDDVAYSIVQSMSGTMNLQFSSSATLVPMEYKDLHQVTVAGTPDAGSEGDGT